MLFKRIAVFLLALLLIFNPMCMRPAYTAEDPTTPTNLYEEYMEFDDDDFGYIDPNTIERKVFIDFLQRPEKYGDEVILIAILMDFHPNDNPIFEWQYSSDCENWEIFENENEKTLTFILTPENIHWYCRVIVRI